MISIEEYISACLDAGRVRDAFEHILERAIAAADIPEKAGIDLDSFERLRNCLTSVIEYLQKARRDL